MGWGLLVHLLKLLYFVVKLPVTFSDVHDLKRLHSDILPIRPLSSRRHSAVLESSQRYDGAAVAFFGSEVLMTSERVRACSAVRLSSR